MTTTEQTAPRPVQTKRVRISVENLPAMALGDLWLGLTRHELWLTFAIHEIKQRFRRSTLGPFWLTLSMGIMIGALGMVFSQLLNQDLSTFLPYLGTGIIFWTLTTSVINEGCSVFVLGEGYIRNVPMPLSSHFYRMFARNMLIWMHNMVIYLILLAAFGIPVGLSILLVVPGLAIFLLNLAWMGMIAAILSTRYRDIPQVIASLLQVVFFVTPIMWTVESLPKRMAFVHLNPFYHLLEIVRAPLLGIAPSEISWVVSIGMLVIGFPAAILLYRRAYPRIPYWL